MFPSKTIHYKRNITKLSREQQIELLNTQLIHEIRYSGNITKIKQLLEVGADINCFSEDYPLSIALNAQINYDNNDNDNSNDAIDNDNDKEQIKKCMNVSKTEIKYLQMIEFLLKNGADPYFNSLGKSLAYRKKPVVNSTISYFSKLKSEQNRLKFLQIFLQNGVNLSNQKLLFDVIALNLGDKMKQLTKMLQSFDFSQYAQQREKHLFDKFCQFYRLQNQQYEMYINKKRQRRRNKYSKQKIIQNSKIQIDLIKTVLINSKCPNTAHKQYQNLKLINQTNCSINQYNELPFLLQQFLEQNKIHIERGTKISIETVLHRAIMNNPFQLVQLLIQNGADPTINCVCPYRGLAYPHQWKIQIKEKKIIECEEKLIKLEEQRDFLVKNMKEINFDQWKSRRWRNRMQLELNVCNFQIFKAQCSAIQNQLSEYTYLSSEVSCLEFAHMFKVSQQIIQILQQSLQKLYKQKQQKQKQKQGYLQNLKIKEETIV